MAFAVRGRLRSMVAVLGSCFLLSGIVSCGTPETPPEERPEKQQEDGSKQDEPDSPASPSPDEPTEPEMPAAATEQTSDGAKAFVQYYYELLDYGRKTDDFSAFETLSTDACDKCDRQAAKPEDAYFEEGGELRVVEVPESELDAASGQVGIGVKVEQTAGMFVSGLGEEPVPTKADSWVDTVHLKYEENSWIVERID